MASLFSVMDFYLQLHKILVDEQKRILLLTLTGLFVLDKFYMLRTKCLY